MSKRIISIREKPLSNSFCRLDNAERSERSTDDRDSRSDKEPGDQCIGSGYHHFDFVSNRILLDRESYDFGRPKWHLLETLKVPSTYRGMRIVYSYDDGSHDDFNVSEELNIEYYD